MKNFSQKIEVVANTLIIVISIAIGVVLVQRYLFTTPIADQKPRIHPVIGSHTKLKKSDFSNQQKTLILALQTSCHFCNDSSPFYRRLIEDTKNKNIKIIAVLPTNAEESKAHLNELGLTNIEVEQMPLEDIQVSGTPTLILTNENGEITHYWVGKLPPEKEKEVMTSLNL